MLKRKVEYLDYVEDNEISVVKDLRFSYTVKSIKLYEELTDHKFFDDYHQAVDRLMSYLNSAGVDLNTKDMSTEEMMNLIPMMTDPFINEYMMNLVPCLYAEAKDGRLIQGQDTIGNAQNALWFMDLINIEFFFEVFQMIVGSNFSKQQTNTKKTKKS